MDLFATRVINRPSAEVADFFFDAANNPSWQKGMRRCAWETPDPIGVGSTYLQEASFLGLTITSRFEVIEHTQGESITIGTIESTFPIAVTRTVESISPTKCRVTARISGGPGGVFLIAAPLIRRTAQRSVDADYDRLVAHFSN
jgi:hypothetical protein